MKTYYVYIVLCSDNSYYIGITNNIDKRIEEHNYGVDPKCYTYTRRPVKAVFVEEFSNINEAIAREKQIKGWSRKKKEALINGNFSELIVLSKNHGSTILRQAQDDNACHDKI
jgi:putative endonuclease